MANHPQNPNPTQKQATQHKPNTAKALTNQGIGNICVRCVGFVEFFSPRVREQRPPQTKGEKLPAPARTRGQTQHTRHTAAQTHKRRGLRLCWVTRNNPTQTQHTRHTSERTHAAIPLMWSHPSTFQPDSRALVLHVSTAWPSAAAVSDGGGEAGSVDGKKNAANRRVFRSVQGIALVLGTSALIIRLNFV